MKKTIVISIFVFITNLLTAAVSLEIQNVDTDAGTLDIHMTNASDCGYWEGTDQIFDEAMSESDCTTNNGTWFNGEVGGFQFELFDITITDATAPSGFLVSVSTASSVVLGFSMTGATIPAGEGVLTTVSFSDYEGSDICFGTITANNVISDAVGGAVNTDWGECYSAGGCASGIYDCTGVCDGTAVEDECGECDGPGAIYACGCDDIPVGYCDCDGNVEDYCGVCGGDGSTCELDCDSEVCLTIENVDIEAGTLDIFITNSEPVAGFQFELFGITILDITQGSANQYFDIINFNTSTGIVLGVYISGGNIPPGASLLLKVSFTDYLGSDICFGTNPINNVISDTTGIEIETDWGDCYCDPSNPEDDCGVCGGPGAIYECGCNDISAVDNDTGNIITVTSYSWFENLHYDFTFTIGDIIWQNMENAERRIDELRVYCHETGQIWEFDSDQLRSGTRDRDYSEVMDKYEDFTPPDNRPTDAYLYGWAGGTGHYFWLEFHGYAWSDEGDYFDFWMNFDFWPGDEISFPNLEFEYGEFNSSYMPTWWAEGSFNSHFLDEWNYLQEQIMTVGVAACDCDGNVEDMCGECGGDGICDAAVDLSIQNIDISAGTLDIYMENSEPVGGFQFELSGINIESTSGGLAASNGFEIAVNSNMIMGYTLNAGSIPSGEGLLTRIHFSDSFSEEICFGDNPDNNVIANAHGYELSTEWGECVLTESSSFTPDVTLGLSNLYSGHYSDINYGLSQQSGENYLSSGILTSSSGYFDYNGLAEGDSVGYGMIDFIDGTDTSTTSLAFQVEVAQLVSDSLINLYTLITASNNDDFEVGMVFGGYVLENISEGISVYAESPGDYEITNTYSSSVTLSSLFVNPSPGILSFNAQLNSVTGDIYIETFDFEIYDSEESECNSQVCLSIQNVDTTSNTLDIYMENSQLVGGFQFEIFDVEMLSAYGGSAEANDFTISVNADMILGFSMTGATIPAGSGLLTSISFSSYEGSDVCFGTNPQNNAIADAAGYELETEWNCLGDDPPIDYYYLDNGNYAFELVLDSSLVDSIYVELMDGMFQSGYYPEGYDDINNNGQYDEGEEFDDLNDNGVWDSSILYDTYIVFNENYYTYYFNDSSQELTEYYIDLNSSQFCYEENYYTNNVIYPFPQNTQGNERDDWWCFDILLDGVNSTFSFFPFDEAPIDQAYVNLAHAVQGCLDTEACNFDDDANTQLYDLTLCDYDDCSEIPEEFVFNQSSFQAFYFVLSGTDLSGAPLEAGDWIGVFNGDVCVGAREWPGEAVDVPAMGVTDYNGDGIPDPWTEGYLEAGDLPTFRIYDTSEDMIYSAYPNENFAFADAQIFFVEELSMILEYEIILNEGANLKSFYVLPDDTSIENIIGELAGDVWGILGEGMSAAYFNNQWIGYLTHFELTGGYWFFNGSPIQESFFVAGTNYDPDRVYDLHYGANLISYPSMGSADLSSSIPDDVEDFFLSIFSAGIAAINTDSMGWLGSLTTFDGGKGYWAIVSEDLSFSFETGSMARSAMRHYVETPPSGNAFKVTQSPQQAFYFIDNITLDEGVIEEGDWLLSYNDNVVTGIRQWQGVTIDIPAMGLSESKGTEGYFAVGDVPSFKLLKQSTGELIPLGGDVPSWTTNGIYTINGLSEMQPVPEEFVLNSAYPNPFNPVTTLEFGIPIAGDVSIEVYNLQGRMVEILVNQHMRAGYHSVVWNADNHSSGMYFVKIQAGKFLKTQKLMLVK